MTIGERAGMLKLIPLLGLLSGSDKLACCIQSAAGSEGEKCRKGETSSCRAAGERGAGSKRDESPGETEAGSPDHHEQLAMLIVRDGRKSC